MTRQESTSVHADGVNNLFWKLRRDMLAHDISPLVIWSPIIPSCQPGRADLRAARQERPSLRQRAGLADGNTIRQPRLSAPSSTRPSLTIEGGDSRWHINRSQYCQLPAMESKSKPAVALCHGFFHSRKEVSHVRKQWERCVRHASQTQPACKELSLSYQHYSTSRTTREAGK